MADEMSQGDYHREIQSLADSFREACRDGEVDPQDPHTWLHETIDGHQWVIYTAYNFDVLRHSPNDGAMVEHFGSDGVVQDGTLNTAALAYCAMEQDVLEAIDSDGFELNDPDTWTDDDEGEEEAESLPETFTTRPGSPNRGGAY